MIPRRPLPWIGLALVVGCAHEPAVSRSPTPTSSAIIGEETAAPDLALTDPEIRRAEALARYSHAIILSHRGESESALVELREAAALDPGEPELQLQIAHELLRNERADEAVELLDRAIEYGPDDHRLLTVRGISRRELGDTEGAMADFEAARAAAPDEEAPYLQARSILLEQDELERAAALMEEACRRLPDNASMWDRLAEVYVKQASAVPEAKAQNFAGRILNAYEQADRARPGDPNTLARLATTYLGVGRFDDAVETYQRLLDIRPDAFLIREAMAQTFMRANRPSEAIAVYEELVEQEPLVSRFHLRLADLYEATGNLERAQANLESYLVLAPTERQGAWLRLALVRARRGELERAGEALAEARSRFPDSDDPVEARYYFALGVHYERIDEPERADETYRECLDAPEPVGADAAAVYRQIARQAVVKLALLVARGGDPAAALERLADSVVRFPDSPEIPYLQGILLSETGGFDEAAERLAVAERLARAARPELLTADFYFRFGAALERAGRFEDAADRFRSSIEVDDTDPDAFNYLGYMLAEQDMHLEEAERMIQRALELDADNGAYIDSLGWVFFRQGRYERALTELRRAAELIDDDPVVHEHIGDVLNALGRGGEATDAWNRAFELDSENDELRRKLGLPEPADPPADAPAPDAPPSTQPAPAVVPEP